LQTNISIYLPSIPFLLLSFAKKSMKDFKKLTVWNQGISLVVSIYKLSSTFPKEEKYSLCDQMKRSAISIPSNISEGCSRNSEKEKSRFLEIALGSSFELETQLLICQRLGYLNQIDLEILIESIAQTQRMLSGFLAKLRKV
jgi:four helix bundle protein